ncbi:MAG TPA: sugar phosphate isomerase/epimerase, partial [Anaerolineae bacterium]|nr:sugar phosphate isomerase/epimerase [Anaerolineae bacterium]
MKFGVFTVMLPDLTPEEAVQAIKASGYDGVEWRVAPTLSEGRAEA